MDKVVHFEIPSDDPSKAQEFYKKVFGWKMNDVPSMDYTIVVTGPLNKKQMHAESGFINGGIMKRGEDVRNPVITVGVKNVRKTIENVKKAGGYEVTPPTKVGDMGVSAYVEDPEGNIIGLWQMKR